MRKRTFLAVLAMLPLAAFAAGEVAADETPAQSCTGKDCLPDQTDPADACKGLDCDPPTPGEATQCSGQDCQPIQDQVIPGPEDKTVEPQPQ
jgi:hypothetical protein